MLAAPERRALPFLDGRPMIALVLSRARGSDSV